MKGLTVREMPCDTLSMDDLITYTEAAERLEVSRATLYRMVRDGILLPVRIPNPSRRGDSPRIRLSEIQQLQASA